MVHVSSQLRHGDVVTYCSVEFFLLPLDKQKAIWSQTDGPYVRPITSVQLQTRHWIMKDESGEVTSEVRGEGVIGEFPTLVPGRLIVTHAVTATQANVAVALLMLQYWMETCKLQWLLKGD